MNSIDKKFVELVKKLLKWRPRQGLFNSPENRARYEASLEKERKNKGQPAGHFRRFWMIYVIAAPIAALIGSMWWYELGPGRATHLLDKGMIGSAQEVSLTTIVNDIRTAPEPKLLRIEAVLERTEGKPARPMVLCQCGYDHTGGAQYNPKETETQGMHLYKAVLTDPTAFSDLRRLVQERGGDVKGDGALVFAAAFNVGGEEAGWSTQSVISIGLTLILTMAIVASVIFQMRGRAGGPGNSSKAKGLKRVDPDKIPAGFEAIGGNPELVQFLKTFVMFLKERDAFEAIGGEIPTGILLTGPQGTGKTHGGRCLAKEAGVPFFYISGSEFVEMFVGVGAARVRDMFETVRQNLPCILFIDEIDAVGRSRGAGYGGGNDEREQTLNQLLVELEGLATESGVLLIAATNRPDVLDPALKGRFNKMFEVPAPDQNGRLEILEIKAQKPSLKDGMGPDVDLTVIARETRGMVGRGLHKLMNTAWQLEAVKRLGRMPKKGELLQIDLLKAIESLQLGDDMASKVMPYHVQVRTAFHEACHAAVMQFLYMLSLAMQEAGRLAKDDFYAPKVGHVTIVGKSNGAGGVTAGAPDENVMGPGATYHGLIGMVMTAVAGRIGEFHFTGGTTMGNRGDFQAVTQIVTDMVMKVGMSVSSMRSLVIPPFAVGADQRKNPFLGAEIGMGGGSQHFESDESKEQLMSETGALAFAGEFAADLIVEQEIAFVVAVALALLDKETLREKEIEELWTKFGSKDTIAVSQKPLAFFDNPKAMANIDKEKAERRAIGYTPLLFRLPANNEHLKVIKELHAKPAGKPKKTA